jgi:hypothetical protein
MALRVHSSDSKGRALILNCVPEDKEANSHLEDLKKLGTLEVFRADLGEEGSCDEAPRRPGELHVQE